jgi:hypothetical protein
LETSFLSYDCKRIKISLVYLKVNYVKQEDIENKTLYLIT